MMEIVLFVLAALAIYIVASLDSWSTQTLLLYNYALYHDEKFRSKVQDIVEQEGFLKNELNPLARWFMKKFGVFRGMRYFSALIRVPIFFWLLYISTLSEPMFYAAYLFVMFYAGILIGQIVRALAISKRIKKIDYDIKKYVDEV